ncbi:hypothetical protein [Mesorhizobium mediterraneum]|uniref:hypothetical protein n=1 Tax=Mesorhizobium mediterraneum TaxID=43617 RepID=UPI001781D3EC|nr:hypothetical protein [Mesorhizobium mediterraneum]
MTKKVTIKIPVKKGTPNKPHIQPKSHQTGSANQFVQPVNKHELKPFIDWISINITPHEKDQHDIHDAFWTAVSDPKLLADALSAEKKGAGIGFNVAKRVVLPSIDAEKKRPTLFVRHLKEQKRISKLLLNFVPVDLGADGMLDLHVAINMILPDGWLYAVTHGRVTRMDVAVDLPGLTMDSIHFQPQKAAYSQRLFPDGQLETIYIGKSKSAQTVIYDRSKKRAKLGQSMPQCLRIERRMKLGGMKLTNLLGMKNPFLNTKLAVALPGPPNPAKEKEWAMFGDSVKERGLPAALTLLPKDRRVAYKKHIDAHLLPIWNPEEIWKSWQPMLDELKIVSPHW